MPATRAAHRRSPYEPRETIVKELAALIAAMDKDGKHWTADFRKAIKEAQKYRVPSIAKIKTLDDYLKYLDLMVTWAPEYSHDDRRQIYAKIVEFYFFLDQLPVRELHHPDKSTEEPPPLTPSSKETKKPPPLTPLSKWIAKFAKTWGSYLDTPRSAKHVKSFKDDRLFNWEEYMPPPASYLPDENWKAYRTFNQFFARHVKPGMRPIAGLRDDNVLVSPADSTFVNWWQIGEDSQIDVVGEKDGVIYSKGLEWSIEELLHGSAYADRFKGGIFTHSFLNTFDYHRWHTPVEGKILEAKVIQGRAWLDVNVTKVMVKDKNGKWIAVNHLNALDGTGYQFIQTRGLIVLDSPLGLVACLPMGMAQVSSVVLTAGVGVTVRKGEELGYFQFGGSDFVMVFERASNVQLFGQPGVHVQQGTAIGRADPQGFVSHVWPETSHPEPELEILHPE